MLKKKGSVMFSKIYSISDLTQESQDLLKMPKDPIKVTGPIDWPGPGSKINIELQSEMNRKIKFFLDIYESKRSSTILVGVQSERKSKIQTRAASHPIIRVEIANDESTLRHRNPDGLLIEGNHVHLDVPGYGIKFAVPINLQDIVVSKDKSNSIYSFFESVLEVYGVSDKLSINYSLGV